MLGNTQKDGSGETLWVKVNSEGFILPPYEPAAVNGVVTTAPHCDIVIPANFYYVIQSLFVTYTADATVGNRVIAIQILDDNPSIVATFGNDIVLAASTTRHASFGAGHQSAAVFATTYSVSPLPADIHVPAAYTIRATDLAAISTSDTIALAAMVKQVKVPT